ncbi:molybdenum cofactor guanylyltransferase MobA [Aliiruegeria sabulilitoris]|uniref:molybdenum cofactor guanylyltransferase MobA n=1 Tax=Aliiruegeria sabulilitoris TaxID=1510458 RepID=UPI00083324CF|nr:molybdenum cofactor guanylyltransferase MobA [Aliiruegeria sabulilitoris]NDR56800.1 molybdenum cofactor guanylyltransferase MobA [Pseudoruegeria sp. M32A2M]
MGKAANIPAVILAGGLARRMGGGDKPLREIGNRRLLDLVIDRLSPQASSIALNANGPTERFDAFGLPVIPDSLPGYVGPLAGVLAGLDWAAELGASEIVSVAADTPFFPRDLVDRFRTERGAAQIVLAATPHPSKGALRQPTFGLWPVALREDLRQALESGVRKVVQWTDVHATVEVVFDAPDGRDPFFNVNTPADLDIARRRFEEGKV